MFKCPYPNCPHVFADVLTAHHCETTHNLSKKQLTSRYGAPRRLQVDYKAREKNIAMQRVITAKQFSFYR